ncbi:hemerythrin domain-containing protein [Yoonia sp.]|uniref:hemerythrin domain-containing protein n=1 Tax=Yoonia sp. TaxID=2212373 RepID=UPI0019F309BA|nr:hemerythrin domain-containing protein [Yoonia sp.]MBE0414555.1 hemerythrin domain-containing protein [Yoonia sp.]
MTVSLDLATRVALPDTLRVLVAEFPRDAWQENKNFSGLIAFWLQKHMAFRNLLERMNADAEQALDRNADPLHYKRALARFGGMLINELHGHHQIEDAHYFPVMATLDQKVAAGFDLLDQDHHALDGILDGLAKGANAVLQDPTGKDVFRDKVAAFRTQLQDFEPMLNRHLIDEEELVVPVLLKYAPPQFR